jgi:small conductance mechanosensitive channel
MASFRGKTCLALLLAFAGIVGRAHAQAPAADTLSGIRDLLAPIAAASRARDSLALLADKAAGEQRVVIEEQVWQRQLRVQSGLVAAAAEIERQKKQGQDVSAALSAFGDAIRTGWPRYRLYLERRQDVAEELFAARDAAAGAQRLALETRLTEHGERSAQMFKDLVEALLALERIGVDVAEQRKFSIRAIASTAEHITVRLTLFNRNRALTSARAARSPSDEGTRAELDAIEEGIKRTSNNLAIAITLLERLGVETTHLKVNYIVLTGRLTHDIFNLGVLSGLFRHWRTQLLDMLSSQVPRWFFQGLFIAAILAGFRLLAVLTRRVVRRAAARTSFSQLLRDTITGWSYHLVMAVGVVIVLAQVGVQLGPMLAGLGIAGFVLGFALQNTLSNFAAGGMILAYQPFDVGDVIEAGGASGRVQKMSLVSTTILTFDHQTLIVPNSKIWGDVIRNITAQSMRRVDLTFGVSYGDDFEKVERALTEIVIAHEKVLRDPAPVIKLHQLSDSSVNFIVRPWVLTEDYWDVYWDITRAVKLRFDQEGIKIPFPQRELHVNVVKGTLGST